MDAKIKEIRRKNGAVHLRFYSISTVPKSVRTVCASYCVISVLTLNPNK